MSTHWFETNYADSKYATLAPYFVKFESMADLQYYTAEELVDNVSFDDTMLMTEFTQQKNVAALLQPSVSSLLVSWKQMGLVALGAALVIWCWYKESRS